MFGVETVCEFHKLRKNEVSPTFLGLRSLPNLRSGPKVDCKTVGFFLKISKEIVKAWRKSLTRASFTRPGRVRRREKKSVSPQSRSLFSASFQTFCLTARAYLNTQKYGLFCSLAQRL